MTPTRSPDPSTTGAPLNPFSRKSFARSRRSMSLATQTTSLDITSLAVAAIVRSVRLGISPWRPILHHRSPATPPLRGARASGRPGRARGRGLRRFRDEVDATKHGVDARHDDAQRVAEAVRRPAARAPELLARLDVFEALVAERLRAREAVDEAVRELDEQAEPRHPRH